MVKGLLLDVSGTLHVQDTAIAGAVEAVHKLRASQVPFRLTTNTTQISSIQLVEKLNALGFDTSEKEIITSLSVCRHHIVSRSLRPLLLLEDGALDEFAGVDTYNPNAVVVGFAPSQFNYELLNKAFLLLQQGAPLYAIHTGRYFATEQGLSMGPGGYVAALEYCSGVTATVLGKPSVSFLQQALSQINVSPQEVAIVGDDLQTDLGGGAITLGLHRYLVKTGKYRPGDEQHESAKDVQVFSSIVQVIEHVLSLQ
ncbi:haloacid dehalogenase-like hydrolase domain-containing 2 [Spinellus fusiger]|nr:haloacid dehalogenase-like hydrolase domain-containing 2 [Spinellus fusiger]